MSLKNLNPALQLFITTKTGQSYPMVGNISCGFPSPAEDYMDRIPSLDEVLVKHPGATIFGKVNGNSMIDAGLEHGDVLIIDKEAPIAHGKIVICRLDGEFTCKTLDISKSGVVRLVAANPDFQPIVITEDNEFLIEGVVTYIIKKAP